MAERRRSAHPGRPPVVLVAGAAVAAAVAVLPLVYLAVRAAGAGPERVLQVLAGPRTLELALRSVGLATAVTAACVVIGTGAAWLIVRTDLPRPRWFAVLLALPLAVPSYVAGFTWIAEAPGTAGFWGAFGVLTAVSFPYVLLPVAAALRGADAATEEVARSLGHGPLRVLGTVTWRHARPAATAGGLLVALYVLSDFGAVSLMRYETFTLGIYTSYRGTFDRTPAAVLGCVLVALAAVVTWGEARARGRAAHRVGAGVGRPPAPVRLGRWRPVCSAALLGVVAVSIGVPVASLVRWTVTGTATGTDAAELGAAAATTFQVAAMGALLTTLLAIPVGVLAARHRGRTVAALEATAYVGHALPGITVGLAVVFLGVRLAPGLYQELPLLLVGYAVLFLPLAVGGVRAAVASSPPHLEEMARALGAGRVATLRRVTLPLATPGIAAGAALAFLTIAKELPATLMLRPTGTDTLAVALWQHTGVSEYAAAAPYAAALVALAVVPTVLLHRATGGHR